MATSLANKRAYATRHHYSLYVLEAVRPECVRRSAGWFKLLALEEQARQWRVVRDAWCGMRGAGCVVRGAGCVVRGACVRQAVRKSTSEPMPPIEAW